MSDEASISANSHGKLPSYREDAVAVLTRLRDAGHVAYFAGGCVRDLLLGLTPKDYDVATDAPPARVRQLFGNTQAVGAAFGVILVRLNRSVIEVATFRLDHSYEDGRRPTGVTFTTPQADAQRRDFTINGLFLDPLTNGVLDFVGGQKDLAERRLRAIGDPAARFDEDRLRMLRAARFAARFDFTIDEGTEAAIRATAAQLQGISPERIADELRRMLTAVTRGRAFELLWKLGLARTIFRYLPKVAEGAAERAIFKALAPGEEVRFGVALAAISLDAAKGEGGDYPREWLVRGGYKILTRAMRKALRISNEELEEMTNSLDVGYLLEGTLTAAVKKRFLARANSRESRQLLGALAGAGYFSERAGELEREFLELEKTEFAPAALVTGDDLVGEGFAPGPMFKVVLERVYDEQLEGRILEKGEAMAWAKGLARELGKK